MNSKIYTVDGVKKELIQSKIWRTPITICGTLRRLHNRWWIYGNYNSQIVISQKWDSEADLYEDGDIVKLKGYLNYKGQRHDGDIESIIEDIDFSDSKLILNFYPIGAEKIKRENTDSDSVTPVSKGIRRELVFLLICAVIGIILLIVFI